MSQDDDLIRIHRNILNRCRDCLDGTPVTKQFATSAAEWVLKKPGRVTRSDSDRLRMSSATLDKIDYAAKSLRWMSDQKYHHGQQAGEVAQKSVAALRGRRMTFDDLLDACRHFRSVRNAHISRNSKTKQRAKPDRLVLKSGRGAAERLTSESDLKRIGHALSNCLANAEYLPGYAASLRKGESIFYVIKDGDAEPAVALEFNTNSKCARQVRGPQNQSPVQYRRRIMELMAKRGFKVGHCEDLWSIGVCDELLAAREKTERFEVKLQQTNYVFDVVPGAVVFRTPGKISILRSVGWEGHLPVFWSTDVDQDGCWGGEVESACARALVRRACRKDASLREACEVAFSDAPEEFREDWLGTTSA